MSGHYYSKSFDIQFSFPSYLIPVGALSLCLLSAYQFKSKISGGSPEPLDHVKQSPLKTLLPKLSEPEKHGLAYPPDLLPGSRDVQTPYGSLRVYEWGPETGRKVLLVHGISTPCLSVAPLAQTLAENGCRVMLFDLFGRGYSDEPSDLKHDARLYTSQILIALASSPLSWTGTNGFSIVGYSLGGGISTSFTDSFPNLVESLVLLMPSGLVRLSHVGWSSRFLYLSEGILPEPILHSLVRQRLWGGTVSGKPRQSPKTDPTSATAAETAGNQTLLFPHRPSINPTSAVQWQITHHKGFIPAFISSVRYAPITDQHDSWRRIGSRLSAQKANSANQQAMGNGLWRSKVLLILGKTDPIIIPDEVGPDAAECFGPANLETIVIDGGHDVPGTHARDVAKAMLRFWGEDSEKLDTTTEVEVETGT